MPKIARRKYGKFSKPVAATFRPEEDSRFLRISQDSDRSCFSAIEHLDFASECGHMLGMAKQTTQRVSSKSDKTSGAYKSAGTLSDGVVVLTPKSKPTHFTSREIKTTIEKVRRDASTGRFLDVADTKK
ncbi:hypothetical protein WGT02_31580 (plasmid) [Rhizobium sp. T1470]|uniref:hypothetical protein n=1 Tax=unclassified Rhizobium TaxID=2613769 RepID=UPI001AAE45F2|nr:hypothetical protein [Rhizobium sp. T1473]MCA0805909.1 hypothetical protein [Rhizobium sp. T1473]